mmetsp:Transcript_6616/g.7585  ORF Transcript_6616/g.7585 Transcript_6616/m.7585 type:complete len:168 (+) Transcript_6616:242-745(+)|eukprot:CAMPEP_0184029100 /NCGR_PEP_ID=MMETSP0955-20130417/99_1 /TAXON_ID=627963 /ORGANISM="Aplanochytrium sp, Strain PBS07" /LENGTH=167 /DNA_ID=CAMNT_0026314075 /DNA_START=174 /DNA_END=677 /DNA_ORIENTATION=+
MTSPEMLTGLGAALAMFLCALGSCYASAYAGVYAIKQTGGYVKRYVPIIIAGVLSIYGIIMAVILSGKMSNNATLTEADGFKNLAAGLAVGFSCLCSGFGMGKFLQLLILFPEKPKLDDSTEESAREPLMGLSSSNVAYGAPIVLVLIFIEAIGLYGLIVGLILSHV